MSGIIRNKCLYYRTKGPSLGSLARNFNLPEIAGFEMVGGNANQCDPKGAKEKFKSNTNMDSLPVLKWEAVDFLGLRGFCLSQRVSNSVPTGRKAPALKRELWTSLG